MYQSGFARDTELIDLSICLSSNWNTSFSWVLNLLALRLDYDIGCLSLSAFLTALAKTF